MDWSYMQTPMAELIGVEILNSQNANVYGKLFWYNVDWPTFQIDFLRVNGILYQIAPSGTSQMDHGSEWTGSSCPSLTGATDVDVVGGESCQRTPTTMFNCEHTAGVFSQSSCKDNKTTGFSESPRSGKMVNHHPVYTFVQEESESKQTFYLRCRICSKELENHSALVMHERFCKRRKDGEFVCKTCNKDLEKASRLERHSKTHEPVPDCEKCGKQFKALRRKAVHLRLNKCKNLLAEKNGT